MVISILHDLIKLTRGGKPATVQLASAPTNTRAKPAGRRPTAATTARRTSGWPQAVAAAEATGDVDVVVATTAVKTAKTAKTANSRSRQETTVRLAVVRLLRPVRPRLYVFWL
jgi:IS5 family transposase